MTEKDPIQLESGKLACPDCSTPLTNGLVPYYLDGNLLGSFDGIVCEMCHFGLLSEDGYIHSGKIAYQRGQISKSLGIDLNGVIFERPYTLVTQTTNENQKISNYTKNETEMETTSHAEKYIALPPVNLTV